MAPPPAQSETIPQFFHAIDFRVLSPSPDYGRSVRPAAFREMPSGSGAPDRAREEFSRGEEGARPDEIPARTERLAFLRRADWLDPLRARRWRQMLAIFSGLGLLAWIAMSSGGVDINGKPLGTDFVSFYAASRLALDGHAAQVYDTAAHVAAQAHIFGRDIGDAAFFYPPLYLLLCLPLALFPYLLSLALWQGATLLLYLRVVGRFLGERGMLLTVLAFPAVLQTLGHGQNAFLSTALFGGAILAQKQRPVLAGVLFGLLAFKPHLGVAIPFALIATRRWKVFLAAVVTVFSFAALATLAFGMDIWDAYLDASPLALRALREGLVEAYKMDSVYAAIRVAGGGSGLAFLAQGLVSVCAIGAMMILLRRGKRDDDRNPLVVLAALLASPFLLDYDLTLLAVPLAWLMNEARSQHFLPYEKIVMLAAYVLPMVSRSLGHYAHFPLGPPVILALFFVVARRTLRVATVQTVSPAPVPQLRAAAI
jgi:alpha-1,2-mannosyltransferase